MKKLHDVFEEIKRQALLAGRVRTEAAIFGWLAASYAHAGRLQEARAMLEEFLRVAESDMAVFPGRRLKDWESYWHGALEYQEQKDFDHLFDGLRKAGPQE
jgi:hypothetical protein